MTTYRPSCGTIAGLRLHAAVGEKPCGACLAADSARAVEHEARQPIPTPERSDLHDLIAVLARLLDDHERAKRNRTRTAVA